MKENRRKQPAIRPTGNRLIDTAARMLAVIVIGLAILEAGHLMGWW